MHFTYAAKNKKGGKYPEGSRSSCSNFVFDNLIPRKAPQVMQMFEK